MLKKSLFLGFSLLVATLFWYILGEVIVLRDESDGIKKLECVSYAPFDKDESPFDKNYKMSEDRVREDLALIAKYSECIRTYSSAGLEMLPKIARENNLKLYLGAWVGMDKEFSKKEIKAVIRLANEYRDIIKGVIVGNEVLLRGELSKEELAKYIKEVKSAIGDIPITYADVWEFWLKNKELVDSVDFITIHMLPYWEDIPIDVHRAIKHIGDVRERLLALANGKKLLIGETGWPSEGRMREAALPSKIDQALFIREFVKEATKNGWDYNIIEAIDQPWKRVSEGAVGGYWGLFDANRGDKFVLQGDISNFFNYKTLMLETLLLIFIFSMMLKNEQNSKKLAIFSTINLIFALLLVLQIEQFMVTSKNYFEYILSSITILIHTLIYYKTLRYIVDGEKNGLNMLFKASLGLFFFYVIAMAFDGRYRDFVIYAYGISAISMFITKALRYKFYPKISSAVLVICAIVTFVNEKYTNIYSDIWVILVLYIAYEVYKSDIS